MASSEERIKILQMIQDGKISPEDGAKLLEALNRSAGLRPAAPRAPELGETGRYLRVRVTEMSSGKTKVNVNLPLSLVDAGINIASNFVPEVAQADIMSAIRNGVTGKVVDIEEGEDGQRVEIFID